MLKTLQKTTWNKLKVGEVFAVKACWAIFCKTSKNTARLLDICSGDNVCENSDWSYKKRRLIGEIIKRTDSAWISFGRNTNSFPINNCSPNLLIDFEEYYKLPKTVQKLYKEE